MSKEIIGYLCQNCGKNKGEHKAFTFNCRVKGSNKFRGFELSVFYVPNLDKPIYGVIL